MTRSTAKKSAKRETPRIGNATLERPHSRSRIWPLGEIVLCGAPSTLTVPSDWFHLLVVWLQIFHLGRTHQWCTSTSSTIYSISVLLLQCADILLPTFPRTPKQQPRWRFCFSIMTWIWIHIHISSTVTSWLLCCWIPFISFVLGWNRVMSGRIVCGGSLCRLHMIAFFICYQKPGRRMSSPWQEPFVVLVTFGDWVWRPWE